MLSKKILKLKCDWLQGDGSEPIASLSEMRRKKRGEGEIMMEEWGGGRVGWDDEEGGRYKGFEYSE